MKVEHSGKDSFLINFIIELSNDRSFGSKHRPLPDEAEAESLEALLRDSTLCGNGACDATVSLLSTFKLLRFTVAKFEGVEF